MPNQVRAKEFVAKSSKWLRWCDHSYKEMLEYGKSAHVDDAEREFVTVLLLLDAIHDSLAKAARKVGQEAWADALDALRADDPLLLYIWEARNSEAHNALVKWRPDMGHIEMREVLPVTANLIRMGSASHDDGTQRLLFKAFGVATQNEFVEKVKSGHIPSRDEQLSAGIEILSSFRTLALDGFAVSARKGSKWIPAPDRHLEKFLPPSATEAARMAIGFYREKATELQAFIG